jgi:hypothetical protein
MQSALAVAVAVAHLLKQVVAEALEHFLLVGLMPQQQQQ